MTHQIARIGFGEESPNEVAFDMGASKGAITADWTTQISARSASAVGAKQ